MRKVSIVLAAVLLISLPSRAGAQSKSADDGEFSVAAAEHQLSEFRNGLLAQDQRKALAGFSHAQMPDYDRLAHALSLLFQRYQNVRIFYSIRETSMQDEGTRGIALVEFTMETTPYDQMQPPVRRTAELRFEFARIDNSWKVTGLQPLKFFESF